MPQMLTYTVCNPKTQAAMQETKVVLSNSKDAITILFSPENVSERSLLPPAAMAQAAIDAEALEIARRRMKRHAKTWTELANY